jgi:hypothetical protein
VVSFSSGLAGRERKRFAGSRQASSHAMSSDFGRPSVARELGAAAIVSGGGPARAVDDDLADAWQWTDDVAEAPGRELAFLETLEPAVLALRESGAALRVLVRTRSAGAMAPRRRRLLAAGGALVVAAAVAGCLLVPSDTSPAGASDARPPGAASSPADSSAGPREDARASAPDGGTAGSRSPTGAASSEAVDEHGVAGVGAGSGAASAEADLRSDDVVRAVGALLGRRRACFRERDAGCLDSVDQRNAPAMLGDRELVRGSPHDDPLGSVTAVTLVERLGAIALVSGAIADDGSAGTTKPVSLLVVRNETGWRLRSYRVGLGPP